MAKVTQDTQKRNENRSAWKKLESIAITLQIRTWKKYCFKMCSYYIDTNGEEWIVILLPGENVLDQSQSYLYDVKNDTFKPFIKDYPVTSAQHENE